MTYGLWVHLMKDFLLLIDPRCDTVSVTLGMWLSWLWHCCYATRIKVIRLGMNQICFKRLCDGFHLDSVYLNENSFWTKNGQFWSVHFTWTCRHSEIHISKLCPYWSLFHSCCCVGDQFFMGFFFWISGELSFRLD